MPGGESRIRVSVKVSVRDATLILARPLRDGEPAPPGTREGFLVLVEPEFDGSQAPSGESAS
jgi:hypothetical protein